MYSTDFYFSFDMTNWFYNDYYQLITSYKYTMKLHVVYNKMYMRLVNLFKKIS